MDYLREFMFKKCHLVALGCCFSFVASASTIEYTPDEDITPVKSWYMEKDWYPAKQKQSYYPVKPKNKTFITKLFAAKKQPVKPAVTVAPLRIKPVPKRPQVTVPFPARIEPVVENKYPWLISGSVGYTAFQQAGDSSGGALLGRFSIGKALYHVNHTMAGLELGVQNGNRMSLGVPQSTLDEMGSLPIWTTVKPMVDLLATLQVGSDRTPAYLLIKGGVAYRTWEMERQSINNLSQAAAEVQAGVGVPISKMATLNLLYQGVFGADNKFTVNPDSSAYVYNIPVQNGVLLTLTFLL